MKSGLIFEGFALIWNRCGIIQDTFSQYFLFFAHGKQASEKVVCKTKFHMPGQKI